ncbi:MAG: XRE family transcriptional regulator [Gammaproteobacteria bacterium]|nr:XRE family transcriptional regulator [Gammaproteobacteria bacterium]MCB1922667.1 XRE family transcriptional regulator [Gammaproteobacteria bacterium]
MPQTQQLVDTLKFALKAHKKTYAHVAAVWELSEASVKRLFAERNLSIMRLEQACQLVGMEISDLVQLMNQRAQNITQLTREQEDEIAGDRVLLLVTVCALNRWTLAEILQHFTIKETEAIRCLARLDRLKIIDLLPGNRIKLLISANFHWRENGPIQQLFHGRLQDDFFDSRFDRQNERLLVVNGMLSHKSNAMLQKKMERLAREFDELNDDDAGLPLEQRHGVTMVVAMSDWRFGLFADLRR